MKIDGKEGKWFHSQTNLSLYHTGKRHAWQDSINCTEHMNEKVTNITKSYFKMLLRQWTAWLALCARFALASVLLKNAKKNYASVGRLVRDRIFIETLKNFKWTPQHLNELTRWPRKGVKSQITAEARPSVEWNGWLSMDLRQGTMNTHKNCTMLKEEYFFLYKNV